MTTRNASSRKSENQLPRPLTIVQTGNTPLIGSWSIDTRFTRGSHSRSGSNSHSRSGSGYSPRDHRDRNVGPVDLQLRTEHGEISAAFSVVGREFHGTDCDRANLDVQSIHGNIDVRVSRDAECRFRLTASSDTGRVVIALPPDFVGTITHGERTSFSARAFRLVRLGATAATMPTNWLNRPRSRSGSLSNSKVSSNSRGVGNNRSSGSELVTTRGMRHLSVERDGTLRASDAVEVRAGRNVRIIVSGEPTWHANPLVARVMGMFMKH